MEISESLFQKYNIPVPRYTSYPPATSFHTNFTGQDFVEQIKISNNAQPENISIYIHIPFCTQRCHFCGCNTALFQSEEKIRKYIDCLKKEITYIAQFIDKKRVVTQVSWGGGTPNSINPGYVKEVMDVLKSEFAFADFAEIAMECSPAYLDFEDVDTLAAIGFNRISLGIQDFHIDVLDAINRKAPKHDVGEMLAYMKNKGFKGLNLDLVYGLPLQTPASFQENIQQAIQLQPDRIATFSYAHIPWFNSAQKLMDKYTFPSPDEKLQMLVHSINHLVKNGYEVIGMDHFAKQDDELAIAKHNKKLHRNFQGYNTKKTTGQVYAFGASGISQLNGCFAQNIKQLDQYMDAIETNSLAVERGYILTEEDILIRDTINEIMCNGTIDFVEIAENHTCSLQEFLAITKFDKSKIATLIEDKLVEFTGTTLRVTDAGMLVVRNVAVAFDPNFVPAANKYSTTI
ncbi:MAG: oxygen-independent coproporphyrinogen III oxidase [Bacteroidales bacterium]|nr:oxygen-independent coproporphyrinogen III oxidase [Bacteroidales bacterium]